MISIVIIWFLWIVARNYIVESEERWMKVDCSKCNYCYPHNSAWGEYWCKLKDKYVYELQRLKYRFRECEYFNNKESEEER